MEQENNSNNNNDNNENNAWKFASPKTMRPKGEKEKKRYSLSSLPSSTNTSPIATMRHKVRRASANFTLRIQRSLSGGSSPRSMNTPEAIKEINTIDARIEACINENDGKELNFSELSLQILPQNVYNDEFKNLQVLNLNFNAFKIFPAVSIFTNLRNLDLNGNQVEFLPNFISKMVSLQELYLNGRLRRLEELQLNGNPLKELPSSIGCCVGMETLDLSYCQLTHLPGEFTYMTKLIELNLANNKLKELPQPMGRLTRLCVLNLSDNQLINLPLSLGACYGLGKFGAGMNLSRNPIIEDVKILEKWNVGPDHLMHYLETKMNELGPIQLEEYMLPTFDVDQKRKALPTAPQKKTEKEVQYASPFKSNSEGNLNNASNENSSPPTTPGQNRMEEKIIALKRWCHTTIQQELRGNLTTLQEKTNATQDIDQMLQLGAFVKTLKPYTEKAKSTLPPFEVPKPEVPQGASKLEQLRVIISGALGEVALVFRGIQRVLENSESTKEVLSMVQLVKDCKTIFDSNKEILAK